MIIKISKSFLASVSATQTSDLLSQIMEYGHYIDCDFEVQQSLISAVEKNGSTTQKEFARKYKRFDLTKELRNYLTNIIADNYSIKQLIVIVSRPSIILMENLREWPFYQSLIGVYKKDRRFTNLFQLLETAKCQKRILPYQAGGVTEMPQVFKSQNANELKDVAALKICFVFDRDTSSSNLFPWHNTIKMLSEKNSVCDITNDQIYTLRQSPYIWHMWFRRDVESYFPKERFIALGYSIKDSGLVDSYYAKAEEKFKKGVNGKYDKNDTERLPETMSKSDYEVGLQMFNINGAAINELQILLLKFVEII